jgi:phospholipid/cholesterol/gamma-HCH transport system substrate-binding protein
MRRVAVGALVLAVVAAVLLIRGASAPTHRLVVVLDDARGLVKGGDVRVAGIRTGKVTDIELGDDGYPHVTLATTAEPRARARAALRLASLSGERNRYIALDPGTGARLPEDAVLGRDRTRSPVEIDDALSALTPETRRDVRAAVAGLRAGLDDRGTQIRQTLDAAPETLGNTADALRDVQADGAALKALVRDSRAISEELAAGRETVGSAVEETAALLAITARRDRELEATVARLPGALRSANGTLSRAQHTVPVLDDVVQTAAPGVRQLPAAATELRATLRSAEPLLTSARRLTSGAPRELRALEPLLREATPVIVRATPVLRRLGPMLDQARVRLPDFFSFFSNWADFTANYDAGGHAARVGIVLPPGGTNVQEPDENGEGQLSRPYLRTPGALEGEPWRDFEDSFVGGKG